MTYRAEDGGLERRRQSGLTTRVDTGDSAWKSRETTGEIISKRVTVTISRQEIVKAEACSAA